MKSKPAKSCKAWAVIDRKTRRIEADQIYTTPDINLSKGEELIKVEILEWTRNSKSN